ncbi:hypothetical protein [Sulfobacillus harzensis]|uniref:Uncharacterized protein n=1 Tax=Sulfobacillus harzensis TaxID=2729629 RepID=A0A7Y0L5N3_9FIRM|nr:hypothetical protein [Sulfobacillus harzensis]NMP23503.1 hypothetical protein [Sulfobacillus harzensis]
MSRLEQSVKPVLTPMILGHQAETEAAALPLVALWALRTALIAMVMSRSADDLPPVPADDYAALYACRESLKPPESVQLWVGRYGGQQPTLYAQVTPVIFERNGGYTPSLPQAYVFSVLVGEAFVQGIRFTDSHSETSFYEPQGFARIWPPSGPIGWPLKDAMSHQEWRQAQRGGNLKPADGNVDLRPWDAAVNLPPSRLVAGMVQLPTMCGKHYVFYPSVLVAEASRGRFYRFMTMCECGVAYLVETEEDGAHCKEADDPEVILRIYESLEGDEVEFRDHGGVFTCKRIV